MDTTNKDAAKESLSSIEYDSETIILGGRAPKNLNNPDSMADWSDSVEALPMPVRPSSGVPFSAVSLGRRNQKGWNLSVCVDCCRSRSPCSLCSICWRGLDGRPLKRHTASTRTPWECQRRMLSPWPGMSKPSENKCATASFRRSTFSEPNLLEGRGVVVFVGISLSVADCHGAFLRRRPPWLPRLSRALARGSRLRSESQLLGRGWPRNFKYQTLRSGEVSVEDSGCC